MTNRDVQFLIDTIIWMSGSDDFSPSGKAGEEWARRRERVHQIIASVEEPGVSHQSVEDGGQ